MNQIKQFLRAWLYKSPFLELWLYHRSRFLAAPALYAVNFLFQRIIRINADVPWPVHYTSTVRNAKLIKIGRNVDKSFALSGGCYFQGWNGIEIGHDTIFGPGVKIISANHSMADMDKLTLSPPITIGRGCWLGANSVLLPSVRLGDNVIVGAGAVVTKNFPSSTVVGGVPAREISNRTTGHMV